MEKERINRLIQSVGINTFIRYFDDFQKKTTKELVGLFNDKEKNWTPASKAMKASIGKRIFEEGLEKEALRIILRRDFEIIPGGNTTKDMAEKIALQYNITEEHE
ncbi:hypothetical protein EZS27_028053 [termite gut metagenome]|uniref:Uncharacterized protein n=1 Tax=termite gut metagenome TaxID=433724 RepID=A0A5J4QLJ5_9ZZZZ